MFLVSAPPPPQPIESRSRHRMGTEVTPPGPGEQDARGLVRFIEALLAGSTLSRVRVILVLTVVGLCAFLPGFFSIPPIDRDEARYAQATKQMMEAGDYIDIRFQNQPRYLQPVGIYWLHVAAARLTGTGVDAPIWVHRLPSLAGAILAVLLTWWVAMTLAGETAAFAAALFMAASVLLGFEARDGKIDAVLLSTILGAIGFLARAYLSLPVTRVQAALFWVALAAGIMLKGPLILLVVGLTAVTLSWQDRSLAWLRALRLRSGFALMLLLVLPWLVAITVRSGGEFLQIALGPSMLGKVASGQQSHGLPPGTYLLSYWLTFWPASAFVIPAAPWIWRRRHDRPVRFCLAWIVPTWIAFELIVTKLPHYVLPVYPAIATLLALALVDGRRPNRPLAWVMTSGAVIYLALGAGLHFALEGWISVAALIIAGSGAALFGWALHAKRLTPPAFAAVFATGAILLNGATFGLVVPSLESVWVVPRLMGAVVRQANCPNPQIAAAGFHEPSLVFLGGTSTQLVFAPTAADFLQADGCRVAIVERRVEPEFLARLATLGRHAVLRERVTGVSIGRLRRVDIGIYTASP
ncbi:MAG: glycosyl transferase, family 39 [Chthoniobacter sp.]|nr:glycosyl transferase, family 39 [Chthoniobacter sp.]